MAKLYWADEVKRVMEDKLREKTDRLIANRDGDAGDGGSGPEGSGRARGQEGGRERR